MAAQPITLDTRLSRSERLITSEIENGMVFLSTENDMYYGIEDVGYAVWRILAQPQSASTICDTLMEEYDIDRPTCEAQVLKFLDDMVRNGIVKIETSPDPS